MKVKTILTLALAATTLAACHRGKKPPRMDNSKLAISLSKPAKGDRAIYGLACLGCSDTALVLLPNGGGDPVRYNILDATRNHQVFGDIEVGDWVCVMPCEEKDEKNRADMVIDLDQLKATWTYPVMPKLRDVSHLSKRQQARILANMPDSIVDTYMVPRQYGFTLKRMSEAMAVGRVMINKDVDDDSPVEYPCCASVYGMACLQRQADSGAGPPRAGWRGAQREDEARYLHLCIYEGRQSGSLRP